MLAHSRAFRDNSMAPAVTARFAGRRNHLRMYLPPPRSPLPDPGLDDLSSSPVRPSFLLYTERVSFRSFSLSHTLLSCKHHQDFIYHLRSFPTRTVAVPSFASLSLAFPAPFLFFRPPAPCLSFTSLPSFLHIWIPTATATDRPDSCNAPAPRQPCSEQAKQGPPSAQRSAPDRACHYNQPGRYIRGARLPFAPPARIPGPVCVGLRRKRHNATHCSRRTAISWKLHPHTHTLHW